MTLSRASSLEIGQATREVLEEPLQDVAIEAEIRYPHPIEMIKFQLVTSKKP
jgi:hypothetical protein